MKRIFKCSVVLAIMTFINTSSVCLAGEMKGSAEVALGTSSAKEASKSRGAVGPAFGSKAINPKDDSCEQSVFGIPPWYSGLMAHGGDGGCTFTSITYVEGGTAKTDFVKTGAKIASNVIRAALVIVAYVAIGFLIRGGFGYMTSSGSPESMTAAKKTITNALVGMVIALLAASIVNAIGAAIK